MKGTLENLNPLLAPGLSLRPARLEDAESVARLMLDICTADGDPTMAMTSGELRSHWEATDFDLEKNTWVVATQSGRIVGYEELVHRQAHASFSGDGYVQPEFMGLGIGTTLLRALETRARAEMRLAEPGLRVFIRNGMSTKDQVACDMHEAEGYKAIRYQWTMEINLNQMPVVPAWPARIELRSFDLQEHNYSLHLAHEEAFGELWGRAPHTYEDWQHRMTGRDDFDPSQWYIAWDGAEIAGYSLCSNRMGTGYVGSIGVRKPWRHLGLGLALLSHSFAEMFKRGLKTVKLSVDASNPTGATRLYQRAGMHVAAEYVIYEKELRTGRDIIQ